jgi:hypothetical protein
MFTPLKSPPPEVRNKEKLFKHWTNDCMMMEVRTRVDWRQQARERFLSVTGV